ncbi:hypothetical protein GF351_05970 [Candidatus Woesearchaeota archaeon]|nr:hypothetical protein [Candidatus Woesearchaeota archaeon]
MIETVVQHLMIAWEIFIHPWTLRRSLWMILPLMLILVFIHLYFGRHRSEELGWNSAFSNSISLLWICMILSRFLFENYSWSEMLSEPQAMKSLIIIGILVSWVLVLLVLNYFHVMPKRLAFMLSSSDSVYVMAYIVISVIVDGFPLDQKTLIASLALFVIMLSVLQVIKHIIPMTRSAKQVLREREKRDKKEKAGKKAAETRKLKKKGPWARKLLDIRKKFYKMIKSINGDKD